MTLSGELKGTVVITGKQGIEELHRTSFYGRPRGDNLELSLAECAYLIYMKKINVQCDGEELDFERFFIKASNIVKNFELFYIVYKDLRGRGYYVQPSDIGFRVYPRGGHPGKGPAEFLVFVTSERIPLLLTDMKKHLDNSDNKKKRLILAIVDEESDITHYEVRKLTPSGSSVFPHGNLHSAVTLLEDRCMVWEPESSKMLHKEGFFGKPMDEGHLQLSLIESCYLMNCGVLKIEKRNHEKLDFAKFSEIAARIESDFMIKYKVYEMLRNSGLVPKTGFKFGTHFRVYKSFDSISHSDYLVHAISHDHIFSLQQVSRAVRLANSVKKEMIYAVVSDKIDFIAIGRMRL
ncbi:MAG: tRNA-intron lyase [Candidatus Methanoperedens sp.]|nr:tRNA-intron lyase [Candidatus Methanoperedens sp.]